jgi:hypothetical protein
MVDILYFNDMASPRNRPTTIAAAKNEKPMVIGKGELGLYSLKYKEIQSAIAPSHSIPQNAINDKVIKKGPKLKIDVVGLLSS